MISIENGIVWIYNQIGSIICHQLPERTLSASGIKLPICARDTGIYLGIFIGSAFAVIRGRMNANRQPTIPMAILLCLMMVPMMFDGFCSYIGLFRTDNTSRLLTGALFGLALIIFLLPAANYKVEARNEILLLRDPLELVVMLIALSVLCMAVRYEKLPYLITGTLVIASLVFLIVRITYTILAIAFPGKKNTLFIRTAGAVLVIMTVMYLASLYILQPLKTFLMRRS